MHIKPHILPNTLRETALLLNTAVAITLLLSIPDSRFYPHAQSQNRELIIPLTILFYIWLRPLSLLSRLPKSATNSSTPPSYSSASSSSSSQPVSS